jgi:hypothetical protein
MVVEMLDQFGVLASTRDRVLARLGRDIPAVGEIT